MVIHSTLSEEDRRLLADEFHCLGFQYIGRPGTGSLQTQMRRFRSHFGIDWHLCSKLWFLLMPYLIDEVKRAKPMHLLWALLFLKLYDGEEILASKVGCDEKTFRKWTWNIIDLISYLQGEVVSFFFLVFVQTKCILTKNKKIILPFFHFFFFSYHCVSLILHPTLQDLF